MPSDIKSLILEQEMVNLTLQGQDSQYDANVPHFLPQHTDTPATAQLC